MKNLITLLFITLFFSQAQTGFSQFFEPLNGPNGITISELEISADGDIYLLNPARGVFKSADDGQTWEHFMDGIPNQNKSHTQLTASPNGEMYLISDNLFYRLPQGEETWVSKFLQGVSNSTIVSVNPNGNIHVGLNSKDVFYAESGADAFEKIATFPDKIHGMRTFGNDQNFFWYNTWSNHTLYRFSDNGDQIEEVGPSLFGSGSINDFDRLLNGKILLSTTTGMWESTDNTVSWNYVDINSDGEDETIYSTNIHPSGDLYSLTSKGNYYSNNNGDDYEILTDHPFNNIGGVSSQMAFAAQDDIYFSNFSKFLYHSNDDGLSWKRTDELFQYPSVDFITENLEGHLFARSKKIESFEKSEDNGQTWEDFTINDKGIASIDFHENGDYFAVLTAPHFSVFESSDKGQTWQEITPNGTHNLFSDISISPDGRVFLKDKNELLISDDFGLTWEKQGFSTGDLVFPPAYHPNGDIYIGSSKGTFKSSDNGETWVDVLPSLRALQPPHISSSGEIFSIVIDDFIPGFVAPALVLSEDNGATFEQFQDLPSTSSISTFFLCDCDDNLISLGYDQEIYISYDKGAEWENITNNLSYYGYINYLFLDKKNYLYLGMSDDLIYKSKDPTCDFVDAITETNNNQIKVSISPNPLEESALFQIETEKSAHYFLRILDVLGNEVRIEKFNSNAYQFHKENLNSGIYLFQIECENEIIKTGKFIIK